MTPAETSAEIEKHHAAGRTERVGVRGAGLKEPDPRRYV